MDASSVVLYVCLLHILLMGQDVHGGKVPRLKLKGPARIIGGQPATEGEYPYQVSLQFKDGSGHFCGGSIYNRKTIITAAHCAEATTKGDWVVAGITDLRNVTAKKIYKVKKIIMHPRYNPDTLDFDIALLKVNRRIVYSRTVRNIRLPRPDAKLPTPKKDLYVTGWGATVDGKESSFPSNLQKVIVRTFTGQQCRQAYGPGEVTTNMFCAAASGRDSCQGDSGGPLVLKKTLLGIVSWGYGCAQPRYPGVYTYVPRFVKWIRTRRG